MEAAKNQLQLMTLEKAMSGHINGSLSLELKQCFKLIHGNEYKSAITILKSLYEKAHSQIEQSYCLHLLCTLCERTYDIESRQFWMRKWEDLLSQSPSDFTQIASLFHQGVSCYFEAQYNDSLQIFEGLAKNTKTPMRLKALSELHLGLIYRNKNMFKPTDFYLNKALNTAKQCKDERLVLRIEEQLIRLKSYRCLPTIHFQIKTLILNKQFKEAKSKYLEIRKIERKNSILRSLKNLHASLPALLFAENKKGTALKLIKKIEDPSIKLDAIELLLLQGFNNNGLIALKSFLQAKTKLNIKTDEIFTKEGLTLDSLTKMPTEDLKKLGQLLLEVSEPVTKEKICNAVWNIDYNPIAHDNKIHKLIHKFRTTFGDKKVILNCYGKYKINPSLTLKQSS